MMPSRAERITSIPPYSIPIAPRICAVESGTDTVAASSAMRSRWNMSVRNFLFGLENGNHCIPISPVRDLVKRFSSGAPELVCDPYQHCRNCPKPARTPVQGPSIMHGLRLRDDPGFYSRIGMSPKLVSAAALLLNRKCHG